jgi:predicted nucleic acid-binding protein
LDTDFLVAILRKNPEAKRKMDELDIEGRHSTTALNAFEVYYGAYRSRRREVNVKEAKRILARLEVLPLGEDSAEKAGRIFAELEAKGVPLDFRNVLIAGVSLTNRLKIVTRDTEHYSRIVGLQVEVW